MCSMHLIVDLVLLRAAEQLFAKIMIWVAVCFNGMAIPFLGHLTYRHIML